MTTVAQESPVITRVYICPFCLTLWSGASEGSRIWIVRLNLNFLPKQKYFESIYSTKRYLFLITCDLLNKDRRFVWAEGYCATYTVNGQLILNLRSPSECRNVSIKEFLFYVLLVFNWPTAPSVWLSVITVTSLYSSWRIKVSPWRN